MIEIMLASEARRIALEIKKDEFNKQWEELNKTINTAVSKGELTVDVYDSISKDVIEKLRGTPYNYRIETSIQTGPIDYVTRISW